MRHTLPSTLKTIIARAVETVLKDKKIARETPLEYYIDDILLQTYQYACQYFLKQKTLRDSERKTIETLQTDIKDGLDLNLIEQRLLDNLKTIKPVWGEFFGTNRGPIYNFFMKLQEWPCFNWHARLYYKEQQQKQQQSKLHKMTHHIHQQHNQLRDASQRLLQHEESARMMSERLIQQYTTMQELRREKTAHPKPAEEKPPLNIQLVF